MARDGGTQPLRHNLDATASSSCCGVKLPEYAGYINAAFDSEYRSVKTPIFWRTKNGQPAKMRQEAEAGRRRGQYLHWRCRCR
jgi:hypothetical protein